jgi:hypothetical protein
MVRASSAWATRWRYSPCTGTNHSGRTTERRVLSSSCLAWPVACTSSMPECTTRTPRRTSPSITLETFISLPGMGCDERITVSCWSSLSHLLSAEAMRASADMGSPWEPVEITHTRPGSSSRTSSMSSRLRSGMVSRPISRASFTFFFMDRPRVAITRSWAMAASAICWTRWTWLAKQAVTMRRPALAANRSWSTLPTDRSEPGVAALVGVGGVRQEEAHALVLGDGPHDPEVGESAVDRREVELPVAGVEDGALRGVERRGEALGHGVRDGDELAVERAEPPALVVLHHDHAGSTHEAGLVDAVGGEAQAEGRPDDREREVAQQVGQRPVVVLVAVGDDAPFDVVGPIEEPTEVG